MGPRPRGRGVPKPELKPFLSLTPLQWGRARAGAEFHGDCGGEEVVAGLQWGRARAGAELRRVAFIEKDGHVLQWGRARAGAELSPARLGEWFYYALQWGRARAGAELPLSLLPLAQARNTTIATACAVWISFLLMLSREIVIVVQSKAVPSCERGPGFPHHLAARGLNCQRSAMSQTT